MIIGNRSFDNKKTNIMGILNVTPDSFFDGGSYEHVDAALFHIEQMINEGADIIDIGGESTRPGSVPVGEDEELRRILPVLAAAVDRFDIPFSVDTYRTNVAGAAIDAGASMINDVWGLLYRDNEVPMAKVIANSPASVCIMHNAHTIYSYPEKTVDSILAELELSVTMARDYGIDDDKIMIDPGVGFAKDHGMNMSIIANLSSFNHLGYPVLLGTSNKSVIGKALDLPVGERLEGTLATTAYAVMSGCAWVRVHDVKSNKRIIDMMESILDYSK